MDPKDIQRDLALFSDPATDFEFKTAGDQSRARLVRRGEQRTYFINHVSGQIHSQHYQQRHQSLKALLSSDEFADLRAFAATQRRVLASKKLGSLIDPAGVVNPDTAPRDLSLQLGRELIAPKDSNVLNVLLIDGPAGVGKTSFIERMVYERAQDVSLPPILHITSKGRRLSNLPDAIGRTANDLQADFRTDQVPVLARLNALQVAIDGFDELVHAEGYGRAWAALQEFIRQMATGGPLILAGRDTFFDQQDARRTLDRFGTRVDLTMIRLHEVTQETAKTWLRKQGWKSQDLSSRKLQSFFRRSYTRRPFFLSQIARYKSFAAIPAERGSPQAILIDELINREANLLTPALPGVPFEQIKLALGNLLEEMASDIAEREAESIPRENIEFYCDVAFESIAAGEELSAIRHRVGSAALIESDEDRDALRFPHSEIQNHFLARACFRALCGKRPFVPLRSTNFGIDLVEAFADVNRVANAIDSKTATAELLRYLSDEPYAVQLVSNVAALLIASLVRGGSPDESLTLKGVALNEARVFDELGNAVMIEVAAGRLDARGADLSNVRFENCKIGALIVDDTTRFGTSVPEIGTLQIDQPAGLVSQHVKGEIINWLSAHSLAFDVDKISDWRRGTELPLVKYFDRLCRRFMRQHYIRDTQSDIASFLLHDPNWPTIFEMLRAEKRITVEGSAGMAPAGRDAKLYHVIEPESLLFPEGDPNAQRIRLAIIAKAEESSRPSSSSSR